MNKYDFILIGVVLFVFIGLTIFINFNSKSGNKALVYYDNKLVLEVNLDQKRQFYNVLGYNGNVVILKENGKIRVTEEVSPYHICSKQGFISKTYESIVCLPNKIVIKIEGKSNLDGVIG